MPRGYTTRQFTLGNTFGKPKDETKSYISIGLLSKIRHCVPKHLFQTLYYSLFHSHLIYACEIWGQNQTNKLFKGYLRYKTVFYR